jgi:DNA invertase Pin-like site-specific DNA recombinase
MKNPNHSTVTNSDISRTFGYIRVSTREQNEARQVLALHDFGITDEYIFMDKLSGKDFNRPSYQELLHSLQPGEILRADLIQTHESAYRLKSP